ncbi:unnamed protein product [Phytomonas sp. EM1]|nr:unnamed protein product [Phytomonas sp. EM1]|eukprot:CCW61304.1 unnamed protein product [Phytomonas sp. isolate EM1]
MNQWDLIIKTPPDMVVGSGADHGVAAELKSSCVSSAGQTDKQILDYSLQKEDEALGNGAT